MKLPPCDHDECPPTVCKQMTDTELRIAVAEKLGWVWYRIPTPSIGGTQHRALFHPAIHEYEGQIEQWKVRADGTERPVTMDYMESEGYLPNWPESMDACRRDFLPIVESDTAHGWRFYDNLARNLLGQFVSVTTHWEGFRALLIATPRQWCEAFLQYKQ